MRLQLQNQLEALRTSYFLLPMFLALCGIGGAYGVVALDQYVENAKLTGWWWIYSGGADGASTVLSTMAGSIMTVAGIAYSITIAALVLASTQFGPRLLRNFMRDTVNQIVLGAFVGTFLYCILVLRTVRNDPDGGVLVPHLAVSIAIILTIGCLLLLIYFFHHVATSIQATAIVADVARELHHTIDRLFPYHVGHNAPQDQNEPALPDDFQARAIAIRAQKYGYVQAVNLNRLFALAVRDNCIIKLGFRPGDFVTQDEPLLWIYPHSPSLQVLAAHRDKLRRTFIIGEGRTPVQDVEFGVNQLVEVACRALSPGINDPFTAITCLDHLGSALTHLAQVPLPDSCRYDDSGELRVVTERINFAGLADAAFNMIRQYGRDSAAVTIRLLETLTRIAPHAHSAEVRQVLLQHGEMVQRDCRAELPDANDRLDVQERFELLKAALDEPGKSNL